MKRGRPRSIRSLPMTGMGAEDVPAAALREFDRWRDADSLPALRDAWASYCADLEALAARPSRADELADLHTIVDAITGFRASPTALAAHALWQRLDRFPPVARGTFSADPRQLLMFEAALRDCRDRLLLPEAWPTLGPALEVIAAAAAVADPPGFTKRPLAARDRLVEALGDLYASDPEADPDLRASFVRAMLAALGVPVPDRI